MKSVRLARILRQPLLLRPVGAPGDRLDDDDPGGVVRAGLPREAVDTDRGAATDFAVSLLPAQSRLGSGVSVASVTVLTAVTAVALLSALSPIAERDLRLARADARFCSASASTLAKTTPGCRPEASSKTGANRRQRPHHVAI